MVDISIIITIGLFVLGSAFFSSAETSYAALQLYKLEASQKDKKTILGKVMVSLKRNEVRTITTILILNNIVNLSAATYTAIKMEQYFGVNGAAVGTMIITVLIIIFGEIIPKTLASTYPIFFAKITSIVLFPTSILILPISFFLGFITKNNNPTSTENELKQLVNTINSEGVLEDDETTLIEKALDFDDIIVKKVMTPFDKVDIIQTPLDYKKVKHAFMNTSHTRLPVVTKGRVVGILVANEFFRTSHPKMKASEFKIKDAPIVKQTDHLQKVLEEIRKSSIHMAIVNGTKSKWLGIITLEDLIEQIVGDIYDESDKDKDIVMLGPNKIKVNGMSDLKKVFVDFLEVKELPKTNAKTMKEYIHELNDGHECFEGLKIRDNNIDYVVETIDDNIWTIIITNRNEEEENA